MRSFVRQVMANQPSRVLSGRSRRHGRTSAEPGYPSSLLTIVRSVGSGWQGELSGMFAKGGRGPHNGARDSEVGSALARRSVAASAGGQGGASLFCTQSRSSGSHSDSGKSAPSLNASRTSSGVSIGKARLRDLDVRPFLKASQTRVLDAGAEIARSRGRRARRRAVSDLSSCPDDRPRSRDPGAGPPPGRSRPCRGSGTHESE